MHQEVEILSPLHLIRMLYVVEQGSLVIQENEKLLGRAMYENRKYELRLGKYQGNLLLIGIV